jgi:hypothetical protein
MTATTEPNNQVMALWKAQTDLLVNLPEHVAEHVAIIQSYLGTLYQRAQGDEYLMSLISAIWTKVQGLDTLATSQSTVMNSAGIIITALKVQRDELTLELEQVAVLLGQTDISGRVEGAISRLYEGWRDALDTNDIESDSQDELLGVIYGDLESVWGLDEGCGVILMGALRGHTGLTDTQYQAFQSFLRSMGGGS